MRLLLALLGLSSQAQALPPSSSLLPAEGVFSLAMGSPAQKGRLSKVKVDGIDNKDALNFETLADLENAWDAQARRKTTAALKKGDKVLASFWIRGTQSRQESGEALSIFVLELAREPWTKSVEYPVKAGRGWRQYFIPFEAAQDYAAGEAQVIFRMGFPIQAFEVYDLKVENFGAKIRLEELPVTRLTYGGREKDAPWRQAAQKRILELRTAPIVVAVKDAQGRLLPGATVEAIQLKNAFGFGSAVSGDFQAKAKAQERAAYDKAFLENFNCAVEENGFKWAPLAGDWGKNWTLERALGTAQWAKSNGLLFRGHVLVWPSWRNLPKSLKALEKDKKKLRAAVLGHVGELAKKTAGLAGHWDVVNEPFDNHDLQDILGEEILVDAFKAARQADPGARLFINDYAILAGGEGDTAHRRHYEQVLKRLVAKGAPFDGFGMQGHFGAALTGMDYALGILDRYAAAAPGKEIWITEYDIDLNDFGLAADYTRDLLTLLYSHPACGGFLSWGFWDGAHWKGNAPFYFKDWKPKPALKAWQDLVLNQWKTRASGATDSKGVWQGRGHLGQYLVKAQAGKNSMEQKVELTRAGAQVVLTLK